MRTLVFGFLTAASVLGIGAPHASAAVLPPEYAGLELSARLAIVQSHQGPAEQIATADTACAALWGDQAVSGKRAALEVVDAAGYRDPFAKGYTLGVMADVRCTELTWVLTHAL